MVATEFPFKEDLLRVSITLKNKVTAHHNKKATQESKLNESVFEACEAARKLNTIMSTADPVGKQRTVSLIGRGNYKQDQYYGVYFEHPNIVLDVNNVSC